MVETDLTRSRAPIEGEFVVITPPKPPAWSFWVDDFPNLARIIFGAPIGGLVAYAIVHALHLR